MSFEVLPIGANQEFVEWALRRYLDKWRIDGVQQPPDKKWWGIYEQPGKQLALVFGYLVRSDGGLELTDVYLDPSKRGFRAVSFGAKALKAALDDGTIPYCMASTFGKNRRMVKWIAALMGKREPDCLGYVFPGAALDETRRRLVSA